MSPGLDGPHPAFGTPLPHGRERGRGVREGPLIPTCRDYTLSPALRADLFNEFVTQDTGFQFRFSNFDFRVSNFQFLPYCLNNVPD